MAKKIITLGFYDSGTGKHQSNTVYGYKGKVPALCTIGGGTYQIKVLKNWHKKKSSSKVEWVTRNGRIVMIRVF